MINTRYTGLLAGPFTDNAAGSITFGSGDTVEALKPSESGADLTKAVSGQTAITVAYDASNTVKAGQLTRSFPFKLNTAAGAALTAGVTFDYLVQSGSLNGFANASGWQAMTVDTGVGYLPTSAFGGADTVVLVRASYGGKTYPPVSVNVTKVKDAAATSTGGGSGGGGSTAIASTGVSYSMPTGSASFSDATGGGLTGTIPTGKTSATVTASLDFDPSSTNGLGNWTVEAKVRRMVSGAPTDIGVAGSAAVSTVKDGGSYIHTPGHIDLSIPDTGLTAGTTYVWRVDVRVTVSTGKVIIVTGTVEITA